MAGGASNLLVILNYVQGGTKNIVCAIIGMAISCVIAAVVVYFTGFSKDELAKLDEEPADQLEA
jgi:PTS system beta-glucosides-specific IIC component